MEGSLFGSAYGGSGQKPSKSPDDLTVMCECTLEELYMGCMKKLSYERTILGLDGKSTKKSQESIDVEIKPGHAQDNIIKYVGKGNEAYSYPTCNLWWFMCSRFTNQNY
jgi:DnaJ-class molecular chaperone